MIRRFNYTGRRKVPRSRVHVRIVGDGDQLHFDAEFDLGGLSIPDEALLYVEAYHRSAYRRFDFGTVADPRPPADRTLVGIPVRRPLFRLKVVSVIDGIARILAAAEKIVPATTDDEEANRQSLLPVDYEDLGDRIWAIDLDSDWPRLRLNRRLEGIREAARSGAEFGSLVYPEVFRAILARALDDGISDPDCNDEDWGTLWLRFACRELGRPAPPQEADTDATDWIDDAVNAFCVRAQAASNFERLLKERGD